MKKLHEFISPLGEFNKAYAEEENKARAAARLAKLNYRNAKREYKYIKQGVSDNPSIADLQQKLHDESYVGRGAGTGAGLGLLGGAAAMSPLLGTHRGISGVILGGGIGALTGAYAGMQVGGRIRKNKDKNLSANLKPALRELAARSERITEFAMVRDASGRYVEVEEDGGMGVGGAIKAGAGAAALGGAGYGAYRADKAIMGKFAPKVVSGNTAGFGNMAGNSAEKLAAFKSAKANFSGMGAMDQRKAVYGAAGKAFKGGFLSKLAGAAKFLR